LNSYQKLFKELEINATPKNKVITGKISEINNDIRKHAKAFEKNRKEKPESDYDY